ncbi:MAG: hypothetical protein IIA44_02890 [Acidobacteria bacterium]|nr:hypothetical protein [Acidobacteriota bacterium]
MNASGLSSFTRDPIQPNHPSTQSWNHYTYTTNNTTTFVDPTGFGPLAGYAAIGARQGAVFGLVSGTSVRFLAPLSEHAEIDFAEVHILYFVL